MIPVCVSSWSLHSEFLNPNLSGIQARDFPRIAREFGVASIEFYEGDYAHDFMGDEVTEKYAIAIREQCERHGVKVACISAVNDLGRAVDSKSSKRQDLETERKRLEKWARHCEILGCPLLRINLGLSFDMSATRRLKDELRRLCESMPFPSLVFVLENHPVVLNTEKLDRLLDLVREFDSPRIRTCPDLGALEAGLWRDAIR